MLKMALFDCAINEKCCSVDGGRGISLFFIPTPGLFASSRIPTPGNLPSKAQKIVMPVGPAAGLGGWGGGRSLGDWAQLELTDA